MDATLARNILNACIEGEFLEEMPEDEEQIIQDGQYFADEAKKAWDSSMRNDTVATILHLTGELSDEEYEKAVASGSAETPTEEPAGAEKEPKYSSGTPPRSSGGYSESDLRETEAAPADSSAEGMVRKENLPIPKGMGAEEPPDMPRDLVELGDREVRRYHGIYNAFAARARWLLGVATSDLANATYLRDEALRSARRQVDRLDPATEKARTIETINDEAKEDPDYQMWSERVNKHSHDVGIWKTLVEIYQGNVDRLSREWTMRTDEYERGR